LQLASLDGAILGALLNAINSIAIWWAAGKKELIQGEKEIFFVSNGIWAPLSLEEVHASRTRWKESFNTHWQQLCCSIAGACSTSGHFVRCLLDSATALPGWLHIFPLHFIPWSVGVYLHSRIYPQSTALGLGSSTYICFTLHFFTCRFLFYCIYLFYFSKYY